VLPPCGMQRSLLRAATLILTICGEPAGSRSSTSWHSDCHPQVPPRAVRGGRGPRLCLNAQRPRALLAVARAVGTQQRVFCRHRLGGLRGLALALPKERTQPQRISVRHISTCSRLSRSAQHRRDHACDACRPARLGRGRQTGGADKDWQREPCRQRVGSTCGPRRLRSYGTAGQAAVVLAAAPCGAIGGGMQPPCFSRSRRMRGTNWGSRATTTAQLAVYHCSKLRFSRTPASLSAG